jgi:DNA-binding transcriptional LysR family regulator
MIDDLRSMAVFATVVGEGSFRGAATRLGLSPSVVSHHVSQLEKRLGCALLYRSTRQLSLTDDGRVFHESCARAVEAAEEALDRVSQRQRTLSGRLRITAPAMLAGGPFMDDLSEFAEAYPEVDLDLHLDDARLNQLQDGFDVAIRIGWLEDSGLRARQLMNVQRVVCAAPALIAQHDRITHPEALENWPWVHSTMLPKFVDFTNAADETHRVEVNTQLTVNHADAARRLAIHGRGVIVSLGFLLADDLKAGRLVQLLPDWRLQAPGIYAVWPTNVAPGSLALRFVDFLAERLIASKKWAQQLRVDGPPLGEPPGHRSPQLRLPSKRRATASATLMPSTPADKMPPA